MLSPLEQLDVSKAQGQLLESTTSVLLAKGATEKAFSLVLCGIRADQMTLKYVTDIIETFGVPPIYRCWICHRVVVEYLGFLSATERSLSAWHVSRRPADGVGDSFTSQILATQRLRPGWSTALSNRRLHNSCRRNIGLHLDLWQLILGVFC